MLLNMNVFVCAGGCRLVWFPEETGRGRDGRRGCGQSKATPGLWEELEAQQAKLERVDGGSRAAKPIGFAQLHEDDQVATDI